MLQKFKKSVFLHPETLRGRAVVARRAHNPEVAGSSPAPATKQKCDSLQWTALFLHSRDILRKKIFRIKIFVSLPPQLKEALQLIIK